jgi:uncharacterized protein (DUF885 family)
LRRKTAAVVFVIYTVFIFFFSGCAQKHSEIKKKVSETPVQKKFEAYLMKKFRNDLQKDPMNLHYTLKDPEAYGVRQQRNFSKAINKEEIAEEKKQAEEEWMELQKFPYGKLSKEQKETYDVLKETLSMKKNLAAYPYHESMFGTLSGVQSNLPIVLSEYRLEEEKDIESYLELLQQTDDYLESAIRYEKERIRRGLFSDDGSLNEAMMQIRKFCEKPKENILITSFEERISKIGNPTKRKRWMGRNQNIILKEVIPSYEKTAEELRHLKGNQKTPEGLAYYTKGRQYYKALVRYKTGSKKTIREMIELSEKDLRECVDETQKICLKYPEAYDEFLNLNIKPYTGNDPKRIMSTLKNKIKKYYPKPPKVNCKIRYVHTSMEQNSSPAFYMLPAMDAYEDNVIYINRSQMKHTNQLYATLAHEGYPGHLYQNVYYAAKKEAPIRYILEYPGYSEGWATYTEAWSYGTMKEGEREDALARLNVLGLKFNLALCSRVDFGVHYEGWNEKKTTEYLKGFGVRDSLGKKVFCMIVREPANYLSYYIGYKEFEQLNDYYKNQAGKKYNLKTYHKIILDAGPCSFDILKKRIDDNLRMEE